MHLRRAIVACALIVALATSAAITRAQAGDVAASAHDLDSAVEDIQWSDARSVFVLTRLGSLYRSGDGGSSFINQMTIVPDGAHHVLSMHVSPRAPGQIFFTARNRATFHTLDMGRTYHAGPALDIHDVRMHPAQKDWLLASSMSDGCAQTEEGPSGADCYKILHVSKDFGLTFQSILHYVVQFDWSVPIGDVAEASRDSDSVVYVTAHEVQRGSQRFGAWDKLVHFYSSTDFFATKSIVVSHGNRFLFGEHSFLFVAAVDPVDTAQVSLKVSRDNSTAAAGGQPLFHTAMLPENIRLTEHSYTVLDTSEGAVFLHVNHLPFTDNAYAGHVYSSDWSGLAFSLSLPYNHRSAEGRCDFEKVEGLEGIYLANFVDEEMMESEVHAQQDQEESDESSGSAASHSAHAPVPKRHRLRTKTVITFDKGAEWSYLVPPSHDSLGREITCSSAKGGAQAEGECHLHLHGVTDAYGPFYSVGSAVGVVLATGTIGAYLQQNPLDVNTYLSRDGGLSWAEVARGSHIYEVSNHGALVLMAPDAGLTDSILYSFDEGATWTTHRVALERFQVENIITEPEARGMQFVVYGYRGEVGVVIHLDFEGLHERECTGHEHPSEPDRPHHTDRSTDYEKWTPSDRRLNGKCLMGRTVTYARRKQEALCYIPEAFERPIEAANCPCTAADFECDYGYERQKMVFEHGADGAAPNAPCVPMANMPLHANPFDSIPPCGGHASTFRVTKGYRRVPGDTCYGGAEWDAVDAPCPGWLSGSHIGKLVLVLLILLAVSLLVVMIGSKADAGTPLASLINAIKSRLMSAKYKVVGGRESAPHSMADDEAFYLSDVDEFGPTPHVLDGDDAHKRNAAASPSSSIKPLPASGKAKASVPTLAPPSS